MDMGGVGSSCSALRLQYIHAGSSLSRGTRLALALLQRTGLVYLCVPDAIRVPLQPSLPVGSQAFETTNLVTSSRRLGSLRSMGRNGNDHPVGDLSSTIEYINFRLSARVHK